MMATLRTLVALSLVSVVAADVQTCGTLPGPSGGACDDLTRSLVEGAGLDFDALTEITSNEVGLPGPAGTADLLFRAIFDSGGFFYCFGFCLQQDIAPGLLAPIMAGNPTHLERQAFAESCIRDHGHEVFNDVIDDDGATELLTGIPVPSNIIFFLVPNDRVATFVGSPGDFFSPPGTNSVRPGPLFSLSQANPGERDQLVLYSDGTRTLFSWEDKQRAPGSPNGASDNDFSDLVFTLDARLVPDVVTPCDPVCITSSESYDFEGVSSYTGLKASHTSDENCACIDFGA